MPADIATSVRRNKTHANEEAHVAGAVARHPRARGKGEKLGATARSLAILEHVAKSPAPVGVLDIISALELPKATVYRLVDWFISEGYLAREPGRKRILVGSRLTRLAFGALAASMVNSRPHIVLQRLVNKVNETCNIGTLVNGEVMYLDRPGVVRSRGIPQWRGLHRGAGVGRQWRAACRRRHPGPAGPHGHRRRPRAPARASARRRRTRRYIPGRRLTRRPLACSRGK
jgi:IclR helix-turn-helix domain